MKTFSIKKVKVNKGVATEFRRCRSARLSGNSFFCRFLMAGILLFSLSTEAEARSIEEYREAIDKYRQTRAVDYIKYEADAGASPVEFLGGLDMVSRACRESGRTLRVSIPEGRESRFQRLAALAFGAAKVAGVDEMLPQYARFRNTRTHLVGFGEKAEALRVWGADVKDAADNGYFREVRSVDGAPVLIGDMVRTDGGDERAMLLVDASPEFGRPSAARRVGFSTEAFDVRAYNEKGSTGLVSLGGGKYSVDLSNGGFSFVVLRPSAVPETRMDRTKFNVGIWRFRPKEEQPEPNNLRTEERIRDLKDAGVDFAVIKPRTNLVDHVKELELFHKYGLGFARGMFSSCFSASMGDRGELHKTRPVAQYREAQIHDGIDHPAVWLRTLHDEPSALDLPHLAKIVWEVRRDYPGKIPYFDMLPNYGTVCDVGEELAKSQLGTHTYKEYVEAYMRNIPLDYYSMTSFFHQFPENKLLIAYMYRNYAEVAELCRENGRGIWSAGQVNSYEHRRMSVDMMRFQAFFTMCFGTEVQMWSCWAGGWWGDQVLNADGSKSERYDWVKTVDREIKTIAERYMKYRNVATYFAGYKGTMWLDYGNLPSTDLVSTGFFKDVRAADGKPLVVGDMVSRDGSGGHALLVFLSDDPHDEKPCERTVEFRLGIEGTVPMVTGMDGPVTPTASADGMFSLKLKSNRAAFIEYKR